MGTVIGQDVSVKYTRSIPRYVFMVARLNPKLVQHVQHLQDSLNDLCCEDECRSNHQSRSRSGRRVRDVVEVELSMACAHCGGRGTFPNSSSPS